jgi:S-(hydroxymethyl)glutathione dehydrogenase/alcohol dehydrogenase
VPARHDGVLAPGAKGAGRSTIFTPSSARPVKTTLPYGSNRAEVRRSTGQPRHEGSGDGLVGRGRRPYRPSRQAAGRIAAVKTRAALAWEAGKPLSIETIEIGAPRAGEVLVEIRATGICHTDAYALSGADPEGLFPAVLGHEGAGVVREIGPGVTSVAPGDRVIPLYTPECRQCRTCLSRQSNLCTAIRATQGKGVMPDGTSRFRCEGNAVFHDSGCSTFANVTVLPEIALAKVRPDANVAVFGLGGIGLNVIQGARMVGADRIVGVDINPAREAMARRFGMTDFVNPDAVGRDKVVQAIVDLTGGGADFSFECIGNVATMRQALECCHRGWGESIIIGVAAAGQEIATRPFELVAGRVWKGTAFGGARGRTDVPRIVDWSMEGKIAIDPLITHTMPLEQINTAFDLMHAGASIRSGVVY